MKDTLLKRIHNKTIRIGVVGLGYVGLPLAVEKAKAGFETVGFDVQAEKVDMVNAGHNYIGDVVDSDLAALVKAGKLRATTDSSKMWTLLRFVCPRRWTHIRSRILVMCETQLRLLHNILNLRRWWCWNPPPIPAPRKN